MTMTITKQSAISELQPDSVFQYDTKTDTVFNESENFTSPTEAEITAKIAELELAEPIRLLREQRNTLLSATDWQATSDRTMTNEQQIYRQQLRDLPGNSTPSLDDDGNLTGVTWPTKPE